MDITTFEPEHLLSMRLQPSQSHVLEEAANMQDYANFIAKSTYYPVTIMVNELPICVVSIYINGPESGELNSLFSEALSTDETKKYYIPGFKLAKMYVEDVMVAGVIHRLEARIISGNAKQKRLVDFLGFKYEATLEEAGHNRQNIDLYKRLSTWIS